MIDILVLVLKLCQVENKNPLIYGCDLISQIETKVAIGCATYSYEVWI